jgi:hypothetical protein
LEASDGAEKWHNEIVREHQLLDEQFHPPPNENTNPKQSTQTKNKPTDEESSANQAA